MELIVLWRGERQHLFATDGEMVQGLVVEVDGKLTAHLRGHERMGDAFTVEVVVEVGQVETDVLANDIDGSTTGQSGVHVHHTSVETVAGIGCHLAFRLQVVVAMVPVAEADQIAMFQLATLRCACGTGGVEHDEQGGWCDGCLDGFRSLWQGINVLGQQHLALVFIHDGTQ